MHSSSVACVLPPGENVMNAVFHEQLKEKEKIIQMPKSLNPEELAKLMAEVQKGNSKRGSEN